MSELRQLEARLFQGLVLLTLHAEHVGTTDARVRAAAARGELLELRAQLDAERAGGAR